MPILPSALRLWAYDRVMLSLSTAWYAHILQHSPPGAHLLDVGCGPWSAQAANAETLVQRDLRLTGLDIDSDYLAAARDRVTRVGCADRVSLVAEPIEAHVGGPYDGACLVASIMLLEDPVAMLRHVAARLHPGAPIWVALTVQGQASPLSEWLKPRLHHVTSVQFGRVTYPHQLEAWLDAAGLVVVERVVTGQRAPFAWWVVRAVVPSESPTGR